MLEREEQTVNMLKYTLLGLFANSIGVAVIALVFMLFENYLYSEDKED